MARALVMLCFVASTAVAQRPLSDAISIARETECLQSEPLLEHVRTWLDRDVAPADLRIVVEERGEGASFAITRGGSSAVRRFDRLPSDCADRRAALGLAIALAIDDAAAEPIQPRRSPSPIRIGFDLQFQLPIEILPQAAPAGVLGARVDVDRVVAIRADAWVSAIAGGALEPGSVDVQMAGGRLAACLERALGVVILEGCAGAAIGAAIGDGRALPRAREAIVPFASAISRVGALVSLLPWLHLEVAVEGWLALVRPRFDLADAGTVVRSISLPLAGLAPAVGLLIELGP